MNQALSGIRILDMTHVQAGPSCSQLMGFLGADVIKLEPPTGDVTRGQLRDVEGADSLYFTMLNCNKRSITVNLKKPGRERGLHPAPPGVRRGDGELRPGGAGTPRLRLGAGARDQPADRDGLGQGLRERGAVRGLQGVRERRAGDGGLDEHDGRSGGPAVRDRGPDRRLGDRHPLDGWASSPLCCSARRPDAASSSSAR